MHKLLSFLAGVLLGGDACYGLLHQRLALSTGSDSSSVPHADAPPLTVRLHRFQLRPDKLDEFQSWIQFEHDHHAETVATLEREQMYTEGIFRDRVGDPTTIFWLEIHGAQGATTESSPLAIDRAYQRFMADTFVPHSRVTMQPEYTLLPSFLLDAIAAHEQNPKPLANK